MNNIDSKNVNHRRMVWPYGCGIGGGGRLNGHKRTRYSWEVTQKVSARLTCWYKNIN